MGSLQELKASAGSTKSFRTPSPKVREPGCLWFGLSGATAESKWGLDYNALQENKDIPEKTAGEMRGPSAGLPPPPSENTTKIIRPEYFYVILEGDYGKLP